MARICPLGCEEYFHFSNSPLAFFKSFSDNEALRYGSPIRHCTYPIKEKEELFSSPHLPGKKPCLER